MTEATYHASAPAYNWVQRGGVKFNDIYKLRMCAPPVFSLMLHLTDRGITTFIQFDSFQRSYFVLFYV